MQPRWGEARYDDAIRLVQRAVDQAPRAAILRYHFGMALHKNGKQDLALPHLKQAIDAKVDFPGVEEARRIVSPG
jgi:hypothetical protein